MAADKIALARKYGRAHTINVYHDAAAQQIAGLTDGEGDRALLDVIRW